MFGLNEILILAAAPAAQMDGPYPDWKYMVYAAGFVMIAAVCVYNWISASKEHEAERGKQVDKLVKEAKKSAAPKIRASHDLEDNMFD
jgi:hypothetical protein